MTPTIAPPTNSVVVTATTAGTQLGVPLGCAGSSYLWRSAPSAAPDGLCDALGDALGDELAPGDALALGAGFVAPLPSCRENLAS